METRRKDGEGSQEQADTLESSGCSFTEGRGKENGAAPWTVSRMSGWQFRGADPVSHGVRLVFH